MIYFDALSEFRIGDPQIAEGLRYVHAAFTCDVRVFLREDSLEVVEADRESISR